MADALSAAKAALEKANNFTSSVDAQAHVKPKPQKPVHPTYANAPYSTVKAKPKQPTTGDELTEKAKNVQNYMDASKQ